MPVRRRALPRLLATGLVAGTIAVLAAAPPAMAGSAPTAAITIGTTCVGGSAPADPITVTLKRAGARTLTKSAPGGGSFQVCFSRPIRPGDTVTLISGVTREIKVPRLDAVIDRVADTVTGHAGSGALSGAFADCGMGICMVGTIDAITVKSDGTFRHPLPLGGSDWVTLELRRPSGDVFQVEAYAATLRAPGRRSTTVEVLAARAGKLTVTVRNAAGKVRGAATARLKADGRFHALTVSKNGKPVTLRSGDRIRASIARDARLVLPASLAVTGDSTEDIVRGTCYPDLGFSLEVVGTEPFTLAGAADSEGRVEWSEDLVAGDRMTLLCSTAAGDAVRLTGTVS